MWTAQDREAALEWQAEQDLKCPGCGHPRDESMADEDRAPRYDAEILYCWACEARDLAARSAAEASGERTAGMYFVPVERTNGRR